VPRFQDRNLIPQEMIEKLEKRLVPYHMHISLDMLECAHLTSAMLLEVPNMAAMNPDSKRKVISRPFRKNLEHLERNVFSGPPETTRDYVMAAAKALANADWKKCRDLINNLSVWRLIPNSEQVKVLLTKKIQEEGLFTYLLRFGSAFDSISIETLADTFELPSNKVFSIVSKMIGNEDLSASFDGPSNCLIMHKSEASRLQSLALSLTEKAQHLVELNERILELKTASQASQRNEYHNDVSNINSSNINAKGHHQYNQGNNQRNRGMQGNRQGQNRQNNRQGQGNKSHGNRQNNPRNQNRK
jgi:translation initiation factor 3 subunit C